MVRWAKDPHSAQDTAGSTTQPSYVALVSQRPFSGEPAEREQRENVRTRPGRRPRAPRKSRHNRTERSEPRRAERSRGTPVWDLWLRPLRQSPSVPEWRRWQWRRSTLRGRGTEAAGRGSMSGRDSQNKRLYCRADKGPSGPRPNRPRGPGRPRLC
jgi:hypothetical protein